MISYQMALVISTRAVTLLGADAFGAFAETMLFAFRFPMRFWSFVLNWRNLWFYAPA